MSSRHLRGRLQAPVSVSTAREYMWRVAKSVRTDLVLDGVACVAGLEDEDGVARVFRKPRSQREPGGATAHNHEIIRVGDLPVVHDIPPLQIIMQVLVPKRVVVDVAVAAREARGVRGERDGREQETQGPHGGEGMGVRNVRERKVRLVGSVRSHFWLPAFYRPCRLACMACSRAGKLLEAQTSQEPNVVTPGGFRPSGLYGIRLCLAGTHGARPRPG